MLLREVLLTILKGRLFPMKVTNGGLIRTYKRLLADYRNGQQQVDPITTWDYWEINAEGVQSVKFNFEGSDSGAYGLNTPAYICIDDITIQ